MKEVVRTEILKLLEAGIIYPIVDSRWVSPVHCVPKKGGITIVPNDKNELFHKELLQAIVGFRVPAKPLRFEHWGAHEDLSPL